MITADIQKAEAGYLVELFELDLNSIGLAEQYFFHNGSNALGNAVVFNGIAYTRLPIEADGFERNGNGQQARPSLRVANIDGLIGALSRENGDLVKVKFIRRRTFLKYIDAVNFAGGTNPSADPNAAFDDEIYFIDRKANENKIYVEWELASALDLEGTMLPRRQCIQNVCTWVYRSSECGYAGGAVADKTDATTSTPALDDCGKRLNSCRLRFGTGNLPYGAFPAINLIR
ncbi:MAG: phage minor tail protein L [Hydrogenophaga sp.]|nr:phage minor tail protein L [Hydrogenophaga sp.]